MGNAKFKNPKDVKIVFVQLSPAEHRTILGQDLVVEVTKNLDQNIRGISITIH